jgi:hypothetical protein
MAKINASSPLLRFGFFSVLIVILLDVTPN